MGGPVLVIPPTLRQLIVPRRVLEETHILLSGPGEEGCEATVLWLGTVVTAVAARVEAAYFPRQVAYRARFGLAVEIPVEEWTDLALRLPARRFVLAKLHTHAGRAYHSEVDAANPYLCHEGAIAITVPNFARGPLGGLEGWSVNALREGQWVELRPGEVARTILIEEATP